MDRAALTLAIKSRARALGFDLVGIAPAQRSATAEHYRQWLDDGMAGEMGYMQRNVERRQDVTLTLAEAKSVLVCAMSYYTGDPPPELQNDPTRGMISRYAWGDDYHGVMEAKLRELLEWMQGIEWENGRVGAREGEAPAEPTASNQQARQEPRPPSAGSRAHPLTRSPVHGRVYVDTGPLLERDLAARAGIGWFGKHTSLLSKQLGNWFFLGEILLNVELDYDEPTTAHCGTCTQCLSACPTGAIVAPYKLDARRCISYLTIELKGAIPRDLRPLVGNRIYGCDDCLAVCPWNKHAKLASESGFHPRTDLMMPELAPLLQLTEEQFREKFRGSAIKRIKRRGFLRNVAVALGNAKDPEAVPALMQALNDAEPLVRAHAAWALGQIGTEAARAALSERGTVEADEAVTEEIAHALGLNDAGTRGACQVCW